MAIKAERKNGRETGRFLVTQEEDGQVFTHVALNLQAAEALEKALGLAANSNKKRKGGHKPTDDIYRLRDLAKDAKIVWHRTKSETQSIKRLEQAIRYLGPDKDIKTIKTRQLDELVTSLRDAGRTNGTINRYLSTISRALRWACDRELIERLPAVPWQKEVGGRLVWLDHDAEQRVLRYLEKRGQYTYAMCVRVLIATGLRVNELLTLRYEQIAKGWIHLLDPANVKHGGTGSVPLPDELYRPLQLAVMNCELPSYPQLTRAFKRACGELGLAPEITLHTLRHTTATRLTSLGVSTAIVQKMLRHRNVATTLRYAKVEPEALRQASLKLIEESSRRQTQASKEHEDDDEDADEEPELV